MATDKLNTQVTLVNDRVRFSGSARNNPAVTMDYFPPIGDGDGYTGLEMLLLSLSCCSSTAIKVLLQKMNRQVTGLTVDASGTRQETPPYAFSRICLGFTIISPDAESDDITRAISIAEASMCPVWAMVKGNVEIDVTYRLQRH